MTSFLLVVICGLFLTMIYYGVVLPVQFYANKNFNRRSDWIVPPFLEKIPKDTKSFFTGHFLDPFIKFEQDEVFIAATDFEFYPLPLLQFEHYYIKGIFLTNKRLILIRFPLTSLRSIKHRPISFEDIEDVEVAKSRGKITLWKSPGFVRLCLKSGEIYQFFPNCRLLSSDRIDGYQKIMEFLRNFRKSNRR